jgi:hypothetical protein
VPLYFPSTTSTPFVIYFLVEPKPNIDHRLGVSVGGVAAGALSLTSVVSATASAGFVSEQMFMEADTSKRSSQKSATTVLA